MTHELDATEDAWVPEWSDAAASAIERDIVRYAAVPDLADMLARARAMDPDAVPADWDDLAALEEEVVQLARARALQRPTADAGVAGFAAALRADIEVGLRERQMAAIPIAPQPRRRAPLAIAAVTLLAAAILLWFAVPRILAVLDDEGSRGSTEAAQSIAPDREPEPYRVREPELAPVPPPAELGAAEDTESTTGEPEATTGEETIAKRKRPTVSLDDLEAQALAAWRAGDLATAERLMLKIAKSSRAARAELAYGDLFALARQRRGVAGQVAMWRDYLRRFPRGRFADDARGGLCRRAENADDARACWTDYLRHHPSGTHAKEAARWTSTPQ